MARSAPPPTRPSTTRARAERPIQPLIAVAVAAALLLISAPQLAVQPSLGGAVTWLVLAIAGGASIMHPVISCTAIAVLLTVVASNASLPIGLGVLGAPIAIGACAARTTVRAVALLSAWILAALVVATVVDARSLEDVVSGAGVWAALLAAAAVIGSALGRARRRREAALAAQRRALALELHDTALRATTEIVLRAEATRLLSGIPADESAALAGLAASARDAVRQLRASLDSLDPPAAVPGAPGEPDRAVARAVPRPPAVSALIDEHLGSLVESGFDVRCEIGPIPGLSARTAIALDRALAEVRANIVRHADPAAPVHVLADADGARVHLRIANTSRVASDPALSGGRGVSGIRSRFAPLGGDITAADADGEHITELSLPLIGDEPARSTDHS